MSGGWTFDSRWRLLEAARDRIAVTETPQSLIEVVRTTARTVCSADGVSFVLRDGDDCHYVEEDAIGPLWKGQRFPMSACISGWAMREGQTVTIRDVFADPRVPHDAYRATFVKSLIMVPVRTTSPVAAIGAYWGHTRDFTIQEIATIESLADAIGEAMRRTKAA
jgi:GAF domain-containing protein